MKKTLLLTMIFAFTGLCVFAQSNKNIVTHKAKPAGMYLDHAASKSAGIPYSVPVVPIGKSSAAINGVILGSSGNLYTIISSESNMVAADQDLNTIVFIHRNDPDFFGGDVGMYRFDVSMDGGATWSSNNGVVNPSANGTQVTPSGADTLHGRYPQVALYNPEGNTDPNKAYMIYFGPYHTGSGGNDIWNGTFSGVGRLDADSSTYTESHIWRNEGNVLIPNSLVKSDNKVYWAVDWEYDGTTANEIVVYKGIWSDLLRDVSWTVHTTLDPGHTLDNTGSSSATGLHIDFDPSGKIGWIAFVGDISATGVYNPIFYNTKDGGNTWSGPTEVLMSAIDTIANSLDTLGTGVPTSGFETDFVVDMNGNPHYGTVVGAGDAYSIQSSLTLNMWDIYWDDEAEEWSALLLDTVYSFRATLVGDIDSDNRVQYSKTEDGSVLFFGWADSDPAVSGGDNSTPNFLCKAWDVANQTMHPTVNFTEGSSYDGSALFISIGTTCLEDSGKYIIPLVVADPWTGDPLKTTDYHFLQGIEMDESGFTIDMGAPVIDLIGNQFVTVVKDSAYNDDGATAWDNVDGDITDSIATVDSVDNTSVGTYSVRYNVVDDAGYWAEEVVRWVTVVGVKDTVDPTITLVGMDTVTVEFGDMYSDSGATATDAVSGDISDQIVWWDNMEDTVGTFMFWYTVTDGAGNQSDTIFRVVTVEDNTAPTLAIIGNNPYDLAKTATWIEPGALAIDNLDGDISDQVVIGGTVDNNTLGTYTLTYDVTDANGNAAAQLTRTVNVKYLTAIEESISAEAIQVYPNPTAGAFLLDVTALGNKKAEVAIFNILGEKVRMIETSNLSAGKYVIDLSNESNGMFIVRIETADTVITKKVVLDK
ncbi:MAG: DUF5011 domain-containing protein [Bacteroidia bacterium]|nr:DUF5011 domain-containing protein [Bacteroidia bacterium]